MWENNSKHSEGLKICTWISSFACKRKFKITVTETRQNFYLSLVNQIWRLVFQGWLGCLYIFKGAFLVAKTVKKKKKICLQCRKLGFNPLGWEDPLENPMDRRAWQATAHGVTKSQTQLSNQHFHIFKNLGPFYTVFFFHMHNFHYALSSALDSTFVFYHRGRRKCSKKSMYLYDPFKDFSENSHHRLIYVLSSYVEALTPASRM